MRDIGGTPAEIVLANCAARAYDDRPMFANRGVEVVVYWPNPTDVVYAWRGTERNYADILTDMRAVPWWASRLGWCHKGFLRGVQAV